MPHFEQRKLITILINQFPNSQLNLADTRVLFDKTKFVSGACQVMLKMKMKFSFYLNGLPIYYKERN